MILNLFIITKITSLLLEKAIVNVEQFKSEISEIISFFVEKII